MRKFKVICKWVVMVLLALVIASGMASCMDKAMKAQQEHDRIHQCHPTGVSEDNSYFMPMTDGNGNMTIMYIPNVNYQYQCDYGLEWR